MDLEFNLHLPLSAREYKNAQARAYARGEADLFQHIYGKRGLNSGRHSDRAYRNAYAAKCKQKDPARALWYNAKHRATKLGLPFSIEVSDIVIPSHCPVLGIELKLGRDSGIECSPSLDKFVPELGYVPGNVYVISHRANSLKRDGTLEEMRALVAWMETKA